MIGDKIENEAGNHAIELGVAEWQVLGVGLMQLGAHQLQPLPG